MKEEIWKDVIGYEGLYQVSNKGDVVSLNYKNTKTKRVLSKRVTDKGYIHYVLYKNKIAKSYKAHRIIAKSFIENHFNYPQVNHIDGDKTNNNVDNLEWCTNLQNCRHSWNILKRECKVYGEKHHFSKLKIKDVKEIIKTTGIISSRKIGAIYGIDKSSVLSIRNGKSWKQIIV